jgi:hypothetical protein
MMLALDLLVMVLCRSSHSVSDIIHAVRADQDFTTRAWVKELNTSQFVNFRSSNEVAIGIRKSANPFDKRIACYY